MPGEVPVQRRKQENSTAMRKRGRKAGMAEAVTEKTDKEAQHAPWRAMWEKETGKKYGIATAGDYNSWLAKKRAEMQKKKESGQSAKSQGAALKPGSKQ
jgi:hypothetical protein